MTGVSVRILAFLCERLPLILVSSSATYILGYMDWCFVHCTGLYCMTMGLH